MRPKTCMLARMTTLAFTERGQGPACLLVHAFPFDSRMWESQIEALAPSHRVIAPDLRGFGRSANLPPARSVDEHADDLAALLDRLRVDRAAVVGLSMGGYIAFAMLRRHPSRVRALVLADTRALPDTEEGKRNRQTNIDFVREQGSAALMQKLLPALVAERADETVKQRVLEIGGSQIADGVANALMALRDRPDSTELLPRIAVPTAVIVGQEDSLSPVAEMQAMAHAIPNASFTVLQGVGHLSNLESSSAFNEALLNALG